MAAPPILVSGLNHAYGKGELRKQILFDVGVEIRSGEIVIVTGPSGSGKTTLLTLVGALRSAQEGSVQILGEELLVVFDDFGAAFGFMLLFLSSVIVWGTLKLTGQTLKSMMG